MRRILFPTDFTEHAERAQAYALALARRFDAEVELLTSVYVSPVPVGPYTYAPPRDYLERSREVARAALEEAARAFSEQGVRATCRLADRDPSLDLRKIRAGQKYRLHHDLADRPAPRSLQPRRMTPA